MDERPFIRITDEDIAQANRLSLNCPICASPVEDNVDSDALVPIVCAQCHTLYHQACWQQNNGKCAVLGCGHDKYFPHGAEPGPRLTIKYSDLPKDVSRAPISANGTKKLKAQEKRLQREIQRRGFWGDLFESILRAIRIWR